MGYLVAAANNFFEFIHEFGWLAAFQIFKNNRSQGSLKALQIRGYRSPFYYRQNTTDFPILRIVIGRQLVYKKLRNPSFIIDAGANVGYVSVLYARMFKGAAIVAIEMERSNYDLMLKNALPYPNIAPIMAALWIHSRGISFSSNSSHDAYSLVDDKPADCQVNSVTLIDIMNLNENKPIDLLKLDIEGAEIEILNFMKENGIQPKVLVAELHERFRPGCVAALENYLGGRNYSREKIYEYEVIEFV